MLLLIKITCALLIEPELKTELIIIQSLLQSLVRSYLFSDSSPPDPKDEKKNDKTKMNEKYFKLCAYVFDLEYFKEIHLLELISNIFGDFQSFPTLRYFKCKLAFYAASAIVWKRRPDLGADVNEKICSHIKFSIFNLYPQPPAVKGLLLLVSNQIGTKMDKEKENLDYRKYFLILSLIDLSLDKIFLSAAGFDKHRNHLRKHLEAINFNLPDSTMMNIARFRVRF